MDNMVHPRVNNDYHIGLFAGAWFAKRDMTFTKEQVEIEALEVYEWSANLIVLERSEFITGFVEGYQGYIDGIV